MPDKPNRKELKEFFQNKNNYWRDRVNAKRTYDGLEPIDWENVLHYALDEHYFEDSWPYENEIKVVIEKTIETYFLKSNIKIKNKIPYGIVVDAITLLLNQDKDLRNHHIYRLGKYAKNKLRASNILYKGKWEKISSGSAEKIIELLRIEVENLGGELKKSLNYFDNLIDQAIIFKILNYILEKYITNGPHRVKDYGWGQIVRKELEFYETGWKPIFKKSYQ